MNLELIKKLQLQAGGSHYSSINPEMQLSFAKLILAECINAVRNTDTTHAFTTFDKDVIDSTIDKSVSAIEERFDYHVVTPEKKSSQNHKEIRSQL
jgi:hypothetical protein